MKVMKRNGTEVIFDITKIIAAITKANNTIEEDARMTPVQIQRIAESVELSCQKMNRSPSVEEIQDLVESQIMAHGAYEVAKNYITYRYVRSRSARAIPPTRRSSASSSAATRRPSRRTPTRTRW